MSVRFYINFTELKKIQGFFMIRDINIRDINHVQKILNDIRDYVRAYEDQIGELSENACENIRFQLAEIDGFIIGPQKYTGHNMAMADIRIMSYWEYIDGKCEINEMFDKISDDFSKGATEICEEDNRKRNRTNN